MQRTGHPAGPRQAVGPSSAELHGGAFLAGTAAAQINGWGAKQTHRQHPFGGEEPTSQSLSMMRSSPASFATQTVFGCAPCEPEQRKPKKSSGWRARLASSARSPSKNHVPTRPLPAPVKTPRSRGRACADAMGRRKSFGIGGPTLHVFKKSRKRGAAKPCKAPVCTERHPPFVRMPRLLFCVCSCTHAPTC